VKEIQREIVQLAHQAGFDKVEEAGIAKLIDGNAEPLSNKVLLHL
jgi:hypothetical protein